MGIAQDSDLRTFFGKLLEWSKNAQKVYLLAFVTKENFEYLKLAIFRMRFSKINHCVRAKMSQTGATGLHKSKR